MENKIWVSVTLDKGLDIKEINRLQSPSFTKKKSSFHKHNTERVKGTPKKTRSESSSDDE